MLATWQCKKRGEQLERLGRRSGRDIPRDGALHGVFRKLAAVGGSIWSNCHYEYSSASSGVRMQVSSRSLSGRVLGR